MIQGFSHVGLSTHDMDKTIWFYCDVLACRLVAQEKIHTGGQGTIRQVSIEVGPGQYLVFMQANGVADIPETHDTGINRGLGLPLGMVHIALKIPSLDALADWQRRLAEGGFAPSPITDLGAAKSVFLRDPNDLQLELCCQTRPFDDGDLQRETEGSIPGATERPPPANASDDQCRQ
jgi:catechol 2,3-dioxygenase-like lactoylglutathione lyase family enzyme